MLHKRTAFTLIELLIVIAIIGILVIIAIPNYLEAQARTKVARGIAELRTLDMALQQYHLDHNAYIPSNDWALALYVLGMPGGRLPYLDLLTSPVPYLTSVSFEDPFQVNRRRSSRNYYSIAENQLKVARIYKYSLFNERNGGQMAQWYDPEMGVWYAFECVGPDRTYHNLAGILHRWSKYNIRTNLVYDPTNGTVSSGSIWRIGGMRCKFGDPLAETVSASSLSVVN